MDKVKVILILLLSLVALFVIIKLFSKVFDFCAKKYGSLDGKTRKIIQIVFFVFIAAWPVLTSSLPYLQRTSVMVLLYIVLALSLNFVLGFAGQLSMGHSAFYGIGAYITALLMVNFNVSFWIALPLSALGAGLFGVLLGMPTLRLKGDYLAIVTVGFGEIIRLVLVNWIKVTRGPAGIPGIPSPTLFGFKLNGNIHFYYLLLLLVILTVVISQRLLNSRLGRGMVAVMDDEIAAEAMGVNSTKLKVLSFVLGAVIAGMAGSVFATFIHYVNPDNFTYMESVTILCMVVLGGVGSIPGVIVGAVILTAMPELLRDISTYRYAIYGLMLILMMIIRPQGMISSSSRRRGS